MKDQKDMENNMKSLVELYPDLFDVQNNSFFVNEELAISLSVKNSIFRLDKKANEYAIWQIDDHKNHQDAVEECKERFIDGACWYITNFSRLFPLQDNELKAVLKTAREIYAKNYCNQLFPDSEGLSKNEAEEFVLYIKEDFREGVRWAAYSKFCQIAEVELSKNKRKSDRTHKKKP